MMKKGRYIALALFGAACAAALPGLLQLRVNPDATKDALPETGERAAVYARYLELFPPDYGGAVVLTGEVCTAEHWAMFQELTSDLADSPLVRRVFSLPTAEYVAGEGDVVEVNEFVDIDVPPDSSYCAVAADYPPYRDLLINEDGDAVAIYLVAREDVDAVQFSDHIEKIIAPYVKEFGPHPNIRIFQTGEMHGSAELSRLTSESMGLLPIVLIVMLVVAWAQTRSFLVGSLSAITGLAAVYFTMAVNGYAGWMLNPVTAVVSNLLVPLGTAFTVHAAAYLGGKHRLFWGYFPRDAAWPYLLATLTTIVGFGATSLAEAPQVREMGYMGVIGIVACAFTAFTFMFPILMWVRPKHQAEAVRAQLPNLLRRTLAFSKPTLLLLLVGLTIVTVAGMTRLRVDYGPIDYFEEDNPVFWHIESGAEHFGRYAIPMVIFESDDGDVLEPELWRRLHTFVSEMETKYPGLHAAWMHAQLAQLSRAFTADQATPLAFPDSRELIAQFLLFFDESDVESYLSWDRSAMAIIFQVPFKRSSEYMHFKEDVDAFRQASGIDAHLTGRVAGFFEEGEEIARDNLRSTWIGIGVVFVLFLVLFRAPRLAAFGIFANALPVFGTLAFLGLADVPLDFGTSIVAAIALGLVLDDTGHLLARYHQYKKEGSVPGDAIARALQELWRPILITTVTTVLGFSVMNFANLVPFHTFSRLLSAAMLYALIGDMVILPGLLKHFDSR